MNPDSRENVKANPTDLETRLWITLNSTFRKIHTDVERAFAEKGLPTQKWYDILWSIEMAGPDGIWASNLTDNLLFEQSNLSRHLRKMIDQGLISESTCDRDRRAKTLRLTSNGSELRLRMWEVYGPQIHHHMSKLQAEASPESFIRALRSLQPSE